MTTTPSNSASDAIRLALPKGRMQAGVIALLEDAGVHVAASARSYRPTVSLPGMEAKLLKPQNIVEMLQAGTRDAGFAGADWVAELDADVTELLDTELDPVRVVAAAPATILDEGRLPHRALVIASEYERLTRRWIAQRELDAQLVRSYGATEVFPPEDADCIVDNAASGATLHSHDLVVVDELMTSSTRLYASCRALDDPRRRGALEELTLLVRSVLEARRRVMVELNVSAEALPRVLEALPAMRVPTVAPLCENQGFAVKAAVPRRGLPELIVALKARGGSDIVVSKLDQIVP
jgi:ATP phosphoribosyltransferase